MDYFDKKDEIRIAKEKYYNETGNIRLKYAAVISIGISIIIITIMIFGLDSIPIKVQLFMRGCVGLSALVFVILVAIREYRVNVSYFKDRPKRN